jgi:hypothetical protein
MHDDKTRTGQYYSTRAVFPDGKIEKKNEPKEIRHAYWERTGDVVKT